MKLESEGLMEDFELFWKSYPRKKSKGVAYKAWLQTSDIRPPLPELLRCIAVLRASDDWRKDQGKFIPYPASFLRAWGWHDVPEIEQLGVLNEKAWHETVSGVNAMAERLGLGWNERTETFQDFVKRVRHAVSEKVTPIRKEVA